MKGAREGAMKCDRQIGSYGHTREGARKCARKEILGARTYARTHTAGEGGSKLYSFTARRGGPSEEGLTARPHVIVVKLYI